MSDRGAIHHSWRQSGHHEPSLVFLTGGNVALLDADALASFMLDHPQSLGLIAAEQRHRFNAAAATVGVHTRVVWSGEGINYSKGQRTRLLLLERARTVEVGNAAPADRQAVVAR
jgi:hypothetical protein